jgi:hypothetical protein
MKKFHHARLSIIAVVLGLSAASTLLPLSAYADTPAADTKAPTDVMRPEISTPLIAAKALYDAKNIPDAIAKIAETDAVENKTPYEIFAIERTRATYFMAAGDKPKAIKAFEAVVATNYLKNADQLNLIQAIGQLDFQASDYPSTIVWMNRYIKEGGTDVRAQDVLNKAHYLNKDYAEAYKGINAQVQAEFAAGVTPSEQNLALLLSCMNALGDKDGTLNAVVQLTTYYPSSKNWSYLVSQIHTKPGFSEKLYLDIYRLKAELSLMKTAADYADMSELAQRAGLPAEAKKALDMGFAAGVLDKKYTAQLDAANRRAADDLKTMQQGEASANKSKEGNGLINLGMAFATAGQFDKGASLIEQGISKGGVSRLDEAKLHLGLVYYWAGKKDEAIKQLGTVEGADGTAELAKYWIMQINHPLAK